MILELARYVEAVSTGRINPLSSSDFDVRETLLYHCPSCGAPGGWGSRKHSPLCSLQWDIER